MGHRGQRLAAARIPSVRIFAVDWSDKLKGSEESLWLAEVHDGELVTCVAG